MVQSGEMKTSAKMRVAIIAVAILMLGSTVALYMGIVLGYNNNGQAAQESSTKEEKLNDLYAAYLTELDAQAAELSKEYFSTFVKYKSQVKAFNAKSITEVTTKDLVVGTGAEITEGFTDYMAYYIGWLSDETIFDSSFNDAAAPTALGSPLAGGNMIEGWNQGIVGMKIGGIREISIPAELAYGDQAQGTIPANSPLKFVIMMIEPVEMIDWSDEMYELYEELYGGE
ncbi:MAG: FKBP-type peptidyl-prolyl cis-trans isomerase [Candidatus Nomurabacteria bacterium]|jgi:FKBP-type peptidyl-prolyl cis-trans isomerase|nr:FKBP-type peptidyl-prolyl cis-trans isomerase [Candidatus Nomurabacteria bacterium]